MKIKFHHIFVVLAIIISHIMCVVVAYNYRDMLCGIQHAGYSAPASIAFITAIPYLVAIIACIILAVIIKRKETK